MMWPPRWMWIIALPQCLMLVWCVALINKYVASTVIERLPNFSLIVSFPPLALSSLQTSPPSPLPPSVSSPSSSSPSVLVLNDCHRGHFKLFDEDDACRAATRNEVSQPIARSPILGVLVPYRDRSVHLVRFLAHMRAHLCRQIGCTRFHIWVAEDVGPAPFNRGRALNVAFLLATSQAPTLTHVALHDVDMLPHASVDYTPLPDRRWAHLVAQASQFGYDLPYDTYVGGVFLIACTIFRNMNGFSNLFSGWGGEDDDFLRRLRRVATPLGGYLELHRPPKGSGCFESLEWGHTVRDRTQYEHNRKMLQTPTDPDDGLTTLSKDNITWTLVRSWYTHMRIFHMR